MTLSEEVRPSILAGNWYPKDADTLGKHIDTYLANADIAPAKSRILGLISPHAGYIYSGQTAAWGYKLISAQTPETVIILSPMHHYGPGKYVVNGDTAYETPLGDVPVNREMLEALKKHVRIEEMYFDQEHAIEIQLPFLQRLFDRFSILPVMVGHNQPGDVDDIVHGLTEISKERNVLFIASSDMHHINAYEPVIDGDKRVRDALITYNLDLIREVLSQPGCSVCGKVPVSIILEVCRNLGALTVQILHHTCSADVIGNYIPGQYHVGYLSAAIR